MAVGKDTEWKVESAFITVLGNNTDLAGATIRRFNTTTPAVDYPCVVVQCHSVTEEEWSGRQNYQHGAVDVTVMTYVAADADGGKVKGLLGAVRDTIYGSTFVADLTAAVNGLTVFGAVVAQATFENDGDRRRTRSITIDVHVQTTSVPDDSSSSCST